MSQNFTHRFPNIFCPIWVSRLRKTYFWPLGFLSVYPQILVTGYLKNGISNRLKHLGWVRSIGAIKFLLNTISSERYDLDTLI